MHRLHHRATFWSTNSHTHALRQNLCLDQRSTLQHAVDRRQRPGAGGVVVAVADLEVARGLAVKVAWAGAACWAKVVAIPVTVAAERVECLGMATEGDAKVAVEEVSQAAGLPT